MSGEEQSFLSLPEWYIVFSSDEYADHLKEAPPSTFPYLASAAEFWKLKAKVREMTSGRYPNNRGYEVMLYVIGTSYSVELGLKWIYEKSVGRFTEWISGTFSTNPDRIIREKHKAYADFVHVYPWYEFDFFSNLRDFWARTGVRQDPFVRHWERRLFLSFEYLIKAGYGWLIRKATQAGYEPEAGTVFAVGEDDGVTFERLQKGGLVKVLERDDRQGLIEIKRYDDFREAVKQMAAQKNIPRLLEISGNRRIFLTMLHERGTANPIPLGRVSGTSDLPTLPGKERLLVTVPVTELLETIALALGSGMSIEHVFDY